MEARTRLFWRATGWVPCRFKRSPAWLHAEDTVLTKDILTRRAVDPRDMRIAPAAALGSVPSAAGSVLGGSTLLLGGGGGKELGGGGGGLSGISGGVGGGGGKAKAAALQRDLVNENNVIKVRGAGRKGAFQCDTRNASSVGGRNGSLVNKFAA